MSVGRLNSKGFSLVEIVTVAGVIGVLAMLAIPNFIKTADLARKNICIANMRQIRGVVELWAADNQMATDDTPLMCDLVPEYIKRWPKCGSVPYEIPAAGEDPSCPQENPTHVL